MMSMENNLFTKTENAGKFLSEQQRLQKLLSGLGNDYTIVLLINLDTDKFEIVLNQASNNIAHQKKTSPKISHVQFSMHGKKIKAFAWQSQETMLFAWPMETILCLLTETSLWSVILSQIMSA